MEIISENGVPREPTDRRAFPSIRSLNYELVRLTNEDPDDVREPDRQALRDEIAARQADVATIWALLATAGFRLRTVGESPVGYRVVDPQNETRSLPEIGRANTEAEAKEVAVKYLRGAVEV